MHLLVRQLPILLLGILFLGLHPASGEEESKSLEELRTAYLAEKKAAVEPLNKFYIQALERLQKKLSRDGQIDEALNVLARKQEFEKQLANPAPDGVQVLAEASSPTPATSTETTSKNNPPSNEKEFDPVGTVWIWSAPTMRFTFEANGTGFSVSEIPSVGRNEHKWQREGPRTFIVRRTDIDGSLVQFEVLADGDTAVYSNLNGSLFKRMVSRIPSN